jgi:hypothetical protein
MLFDGRLELRDSSCVGWILLKKVFQKEPVSLLVFYKTVDFALL